MSGPRGETGDVDAKIALGLIEAAFAGRARPYALTDSLQLSDVEKEFSPTESGPEFRSQVAKPTPWKESGITHTQRVRRVEGVGTAASNPAVHEDVYLSKPIGRVIGDIKPEDGVPGGPTARDPRLILIGRNGATIDLERDAKTVARTRCGIGASGGGDYHNAK